jgi:hypothetical protein
MSGAILPLPQYAFMAWCLAKHRDNFTFYFIRLYSVEVRHRNNFTQCRDRRMSGSIPPLPNTPSWRGALLSIGTTSIFTLYAFMVW